MPLGSASNDIGSLLVNIFTLLVSIFSFVMVIKSARRMRLEARVTYRAPLIAILTTTISTFLYIAITQATLNAVLASVMLLVGAFLGLLQGRASKLYYQGTNKMIKRNTLYLLIWGLAYVLTMLLSLTGSRVFQASGIMLLLFGFGLAFTSNFVLLLRQLSMRQPKPESAPGS
jgi:hypothetical protein